MIIGDAPIRVGDLCRVGEYLGIIEDIGLRSTRMRTLDRTLVYIPNALLSALSLENLTGRDKIRFLHVLGLQRETTAQQLRRIIDESQKMLLAHPKVDSGTARVRFLKVGDSSLDIEVLAYVLETNVPAFLEVQEDLLLRIMDIIESCGTRLALPSQVEYHVRDSDQPATTETQPTESDVSERQG
jgi:MscS family membrane protein